MKEFGATSHPEAFDCTYLFIPKSSVTTVCHCPAELQQVSASFILVYILKHSIMKN